MQLKFLLFGIFLSAVSFIHAQEKQDLNPCGTQDGRVQWLQDYQKHPGIYPRSNDVLYVPVTVHIVGNSDGSGYFQMTGLLDAFCTLNEDFEPAGIQFFIEGDVLYHANSTWYDHTFQQGGQMMNQKNVPNTINCYIVGSPAGNCGYSSYNSGIALAKNCIGPANHTWAHEAGHYLSLPHPFYGWEGEDFDYSQPAPDYINGEAVERLDGSNCTYASDGFCDTPADYLNYRWGCNSQGFSNTVQKDPTGAEFKSDGTLFMSYALDACANRFSDDQIAAMQSNLMTERANLLYNQTPADPVNLSDFTAIAPLEGDSVATFQDVTFEWESVENAEGYFLDITVLANFQAVLFRHEVQGTSFTTTDLKKNRTYYWRVRAYNRWHTCKELSNIQSFQTGDVETLTGVNAIETVKDLNIYPNPVAPGSEVLVNFHAAEVMTLELNLLNLSGQAVYRQEKQVSAGNQTMNIPTGRLAAGLYFIQFRSENGVMSRKLVVR